MDFIDLQLKIEVLFNSFKLKKIKTALEKDKNGWNWIISIDELTTETNIILHTNFIFKLDSNKKNIRAFDFIYLYDINCRYKLIHFKDGTELIAKLQDILFHAVFGPNLISIGKFMSSPAMEINNYFYNNKIEGCSIYDFQYDPKTIIIPCQRFNMDFTLNVNNSINVELNIKKQKNSKYIFTFKYSNKSESKEEDSLLDITKTVASYIKDILLKK